MKSFFSLVFILVLSNSLLAQKTKEEYAAISDSLRKTKNSKANRIDYFLKEYKKYPKDENVLRYLGHAYMDHSDTKNAEKYYFEALKVNANCARCYMNLANVELLKGDTLKGFEYIQKAVTLDPKDDLIYTVRASFYVMRKEKLKAMEDFDKAVELGPKNANPYIQRGNFNRYIEFYSSAISDFTKAIELDKEEYTAYYLRGDVYSRKNMISEALADYSKAIEMNPDYYEALFERAMIYLDQNENEKALSDFNQTIELRPEMPQSYYYRYIILHQLEQLDKGCLDLNYLLTKFDAKQISDPGVLDYVKTQYADICDSTKPSYYYQRGIASYNLKDFDQSIQYYHRAMEISDHDLMIKSFVGNAYFAKSDYKKAIEIYSEVLSIPNGICEEMKKAPQYEEMMKETEYVCDMALASYYLNLGFSYALTDDFQSAIRDVKKAVELYPADQQTKDEYNLLLICFYLKLNNYTEAKILVDQANKSVKNGWNHLFNALYLLIENNIIGPADLEFHKEFLQKPFSIKPIILSKSDRKKAEPLILSAIQDCDKSIAKNNQNGFAYYLRAILKMSLGHSDYCIDFLSAASMGIFVDHATMGNCEEKK